MTVGTTDGLISLIGRTSTFQIGLFILLAFQTYIPWHSFSVSIAFFGATPRHTCLSRDTIQPGVYVDRPRVVESKATNLSQSASLISSNASQMTSHSAHHILPMYDNSSDLRFQSDNSLIPKIVLDESQVFIEFQSNNSDYHDDVCDVWKTDQCPEVQYEQSLGNTIVMEWDLICDRSYVPAMSQFALSLSGIPGSFIAAVFCDKFGRKPVILGSHLGMLILLVFLSFVNDVWMFVILRCAVNFVGVASIIAGYTYTAEIFPSQFRMYSSICCNIFCSMSVLFTTLVAYLLPEWRLFYFAIGCVSMCIMSYYWLLPESFIWLFSRRRYREAQQVLTLARKINRIENEKLISVYHDHVTDAETAKKLDIRPEQEIVIIKTDPSEDVESAETDKKSAPKEGSLMTLIRSRRILILTLAISFQRFASNVTFWGVTLSMGSLSGDRYVNFIMGALSELPGYIFPAFGLNRYGRKPCLYLFNIGATISFGLLTLSTSYFPGTLVTICAILAKLFLAGNSTTVLLIVGESYPDCVRGVGSGIGMITAMTGASVGAFYGYLATVRSFLPPLLSTILMGLCVLLARALPETRGRSLPRTVSEVESWFTVIRDQQEDVSVNSNVTVTDSLKRGSVDSEPLV